MENCVDMCARHGRRAIEICFSEKGELAKKNWEILLQSICPFWASLPYVLGCHKKFAHFGQA